MEKVYGNKAVRPENLALTEDSAKQRFSKNSHQVQPGLESLSDSLLFGWRVNDDMLVSLFTTQPPGLANLINYIHCACKEDGCTNKRCSCVNHEVPYSLYCS